MVLDKIRGKLTGSKESSSKKSKGKNATLSFDLLYQLSYMSVIAAAGVPRSHIFERSAQLPCATSDYFRKVELNCRKLKYDYAKACRLVGESAKEEEIKALLLRFSSSLLSGEPESDFLTREAEAQAEAYNNEYGRKLETLKLWTDAYVSLILSAVLVIIMGIVSTMIWKIETIFIVGLAVAAISTTMLGVWLIYLMSPKEVMVLNWAGSKEQKLTVKLFKLLVPTALAAFSIIGFVGNNLGWGLIIGAAIILPIGFISARGDKKVTRRDSEVGSFLRSLGGVCAAIGTTVREALNRIDMDSINNLRHEVKRLHTRLIAGISARLCWHRFIEETGSELINRSVGMFYDAIELGGEPERAGHYSSIFASNIAMLRARRKTVSSPFRWLCIAMHAAIIVLLVFITEVITIFGNMVANAEQAMPTISGAPSVGAFTSFNFSGLQLMHSFVMPLVIVFTIANALAPSIADGGSHYKILYNLAITAIISGTSLIFLPSIAGSLFGSVQM